ncbi:RNA 2',3'-cyclic phosphodiesterase [Thalassomonas sp. M1454]|uniref:RNA 2',3'-cyclic phosphodiesterase n=1 Tax=Thalassomonas sp. M1454 TaxID=2594477 RepID=UPI0011809716|nr:RNA 2',3'-cyclic phosphodiesterase [Thalassomonas sp. M1454]TRX53398.1 RNA 2',3'-cyclic phosphodiesterase [Thalassomonas sp. M1454]
MKRLFIGLSIAKQQREQIAQWRQQALSDNSGELFKSVDKDNFHITLSFIGSISADKITPLIAAMNKTLKPKCSIDLNRLDCWPKPKVLFLHASSVQENLLTLATNIIETVKHNNIHQEDRPYIPHLTLCRKAKHAPIITEAFNFKLDFQQCHLYESISSNQGVQYKIIHTWPLN